MRAPVSGYAAWVAPGRKTDVRAITLLITPALAQDVLINEVVYDPASSDDGLEWIELCNASRSTVDLSGWTIENAGASWGAITIGGSTSLTGTIDPGDYILVGYGSLTNPGAFNPNLQNGGGSSGAADGIRILDGSGAVVDTVIYEGTNSNSLIDDWGVPASSVADGASSGDSIARWPDCTDSDDSWIDFWVFDAADVTPGAENVMGSSTGGGADGGGGTCENPASGAPIKINEFELNLNWSDDCPTQIASGEPVQRGGSVVDLSARELCSETNPDDWGPPADIRHSLGYRAGRSSCCLRATRSRPCSNSIPAST